MKVTLKEYLSLLGIERIKVELCVVTEDFKNIIRKIIYKGDSKDFSFFKGKDDAFIEKNWMHDTTPEELKEYLQNYIYITYVDYVENLLTICLTTNKKGE